MELALFDFLIGYSFLVPGIKETKLVFGRRNVHALNDD